MTPLSYSVQHELQNDKNFDKHLVTVWEPHSEASEQYRQLRTYLLDKAKNNATKTFLIASAVPGEGKTITAINLALSLVKGLHETVLLIDANLRNPKASIMLGIEKDTKGLAEYLTYRSDLANFIIKTPIPKLSIIPSGLPPENPSELLNSEHMSDLIKEVKNRYNDRYIIIDSSPVMPVTDATILSTLVDGIIFVIKASSTQRELVNEAINKLENKEKILGLVLNCHKKAYSLNIFTADNSAP